MHSRHSSGLGPVPADPGPPRPKNRTPPLPPGRRRRTRGEASVARPEPSPHLPPPAGSRRGGAGRAGPRAATSCGGAGGRGGPARIPPRAASRRRDGGGAPGCPRSPGGGEGKRGKSDPSAGSFPRPSLGCGSSLLPTASAGAASAPAPQPSLRADTKGSSGASSRCLGTGINKCSPWLRRGRARLSRRGAGGRKGRGRGRAAPP